MEQKIIDGMSDSWDETIICSCLQGVMGEIYTNRRVGKTKSLIYFTLKS